MNIVVQNFKKNKWQYITSLIICVCIVVFDLVSKHFAQQLEEKVEFLPGVLSFLYIKNDGASFGILSGKTVLLIVITALTLVGILIGYIFYSPKSYVYHISAGFLIGGSIGNLVDRMVFGYVRDFLCIDLFDFPVFNIADTFLTLGVVLLFVFLIFIFPKTLKEKELDKK